MIAVMTTLVRTSKSINKEGSLIVAIQICLTSAKDLLALSIATNCFKHQNPCEWSGHHKNDDVEDEVYVTDVDNSRSSLLSPDPAPESHAVASLLWGAKVLLLCYQ